MISVLPSTVTVPVMEPLPLLVKVPPVLFSEAMVPVLVAVPALVSAPAVPLLVKVRARLDGDGTDRAGVRQRAARHLWNCR